MNVEQLLGIAMMVIVTILLWGDWMTMAFLYIPFVLTLGIIHGVKYLRQSRK